MRLLLALRLLAPLSVAAHLVACSPVSQVEDRTCGPPALDAPLARAETADVEFFTIVPDPILSDSQALFVTRIRSRLGVMAVSVARIPDSPATVLQEGKYLGIRLSSAARTVGLIEDAHDVTSLSRHYWSASGPIVGESLGSRFSIFVGEASLIGYLWRQGFHYQFEPVGAGLYAISEANACEIMLPD